MVITNSNSVILTHRVLCSNHRIREDNFMILTTEMEMKYLSMILTTELEMFVEISVILTH